MQIAKWRNAAPEQLPELFVDGRSRKARNEDVDKDALYEEIVPTGPGSSRGHQPLLPVLQLRTAASEPGVPNAGGSLPGPECAAMTESIGRRALLNWGLCPQAPRIYRFTARMAVLLRSTIEALERRIGLRRNSTRAPTQAPEWRGRLRSPKNS
jgi:hypothetical protein